MKNLIYSCIFSNEENLTIIYLLLKSFILFGNASSQVDYLLICQTKFKDKIECMFENLDLNGLIWCLDLNIVFEEEFSKLKIFEYENINLYDKILYLDCYTLITNSINNIFDLQLENKLYVLKEGNSKYENYGSNLFNNNTNLEAFSPDILLFNNDKNIKQLFNDILFDINSQSNNQSKIFKYLNQSYIVYHSIQKKLYNNTILTNLIISNPNKFQGQIVSRFIEDSEKLDNRMIKMKEFINNIMYNINFLFYKKLYKIGLIINPLINKRYSWENSSITFLDNGKMSAFGSGEYTFIDKFKVKCGFGSREHILIFNLNYSDFISIRKDDFQIITNNQNIFDGQTLDITNFGQFGNYDIIKKVEFNIFIKNVLYYNNVLLNKKYSWENSSIVFLDNGQMNAFGKGKYEFIDNYLVKCNFGGRIHLLLFNLNYTDFISIREGDFEIITNNPIIFNNQTLDISNFPKLIEIYNTNIIKINQLKKNIKLDFNPLINIRYGWENLSIKFLNKDKMIAFGSGKYYFVDYYLVKCFFGNHDHLLHFNDEFSNFVSIRKNDFQIIKGHKNKIYKKGREYYHALKYHLIDAYNEINMKIPNNINLIQPPRALFSREYYQSILKLDNDKIYDFTYIGCIEKKNTYRKWIIDFAKKNFTKNSIFINTNANPSGWKLIGDFDFSFSNRTRVCNPKSLKKNHSRQAQYRGISENLYYFNSMTKSKFVLCPRGNDDKWSFRFYEVLMCGSIPIVYNHEDTYRTLDEFFIPYKVQYYNDQILYSNEIIKYNRKLFERFHLLKQ